MPAFRGDSSRLVVCIHKTFALAFWEPVGSPIRSGRPSSKTAGASLVSVASRNAERAAAWAATHGIKQSYGSYQELLDSAGLDAVYIALPPALHHRWTLRAAERGLHVLCEKPLAGSLAEAEEMREACRAADVQLMDGTMWVHTPRAAVMRSVLDSGTLGRLQRVTSAFTLHPDRWSDDEFRLQAGLGGGSLLDLGWYCIGASLWSFGEQPTEVFGRANRVSKGVDVAFTGLLTFSEGRVASFDCGFQTAMRKWVEIAGDQGSLVCDDFTRPRVPEKTRFWLHDRWAASSEQRCPTSSQEADLIAAFCRPLRSGKAEGHWANSAIHVQEVCEALQQSARTGKPVSLS